jgi:hypothetical protein
MLRKSGLVLVFVASLIGAKYAVEFGLQMYKDRQAVIAAEAAFEEIESEAERSASTAPKSVIRQEIAIEKAEQNINSKSTPQQKKKAAVSTFMGFYLVNFRTRTEYCDELGIGISTFTDEFKRLHRDELSVSREVVFKKQADINKLYELIHPQLQKVIAQDMSDIAAQYQVTNVQACQLVEDNGVAFAEAIHVSKIQPSVFRELNN